MVMRKGPSTHDDHVEFAIKGVRNGTSLCYVGETTVRFIFPQLKLGVPESQLKEVETC